MADRLADKTNVLNFLYVYSDQIDAIEFGTETRKLLLTVPISWGKQGSSNVGVYTLINHEHKLQADYHNQIVIQVKTATNKLVPFDSGKFISNITIE